MPNQARDDSHYENQIRNLFFTLCLMTSFSLFIVEELLEAHTDYRDNQLNLYKIDRAKEISEAFQPHCRLTASND